ncbi:ABC transporter ATP-binding protein [Alkalibacter saccharofermentans]|nr:ABC transporter ATP-binding protein [Alkalibacter saccharofermentans]
MIYKKDGKIALKDVNINIEKGEFAALLGQNGAGKTTLINILSGNVKKTSGKIYIGGYDLDKNELETKKLLGVVPQESGFDNFFSVEEVLKKQSGYFGIKRNKEYIHHLLNQLNLFEKRNNYIRELSGGMKRRFQMAKALVHKPEIFILDEPTAGVDIEMRHNMYDFLLELHKSGLTIILTTHYIEEAERLCDRIMVINSGEIVADEPKEILMDRFGREVRVSICFDGPVDAQEWESLKKFHAEVTHHNQIDFKVDKAKLPVLLNAIALKRGDFVDISIEREKLEDVYLQLIKSRKE